MQAGESVSEGKKIRICALLCCFTSALALASPALSQVSYPDHRRYTVQRLADQFGLGAVTVTAMGEDKQGYLWIGTQTGLYRYDGARAQRMNAVENMIGHYVLDMVIAPDGTPWFAGNRGVARYSNEQFESLTIPASALPLGNGTQLLAVDSKGIVYVPLFAHGLVRANPRDPRQTEILGEAQGIKETVTGITRADDDSIWLTFGTHLAHLEAG